jgi:uncharacterized heparinase superfamily protein
VVAAVLEVQRREDTDRQRGDLEAETGGKQGGAGAVAEGVRRQDGDGGAPFDEAPAVAYDRAVKLTAVGVDLDGAPTVRDAARRAVADGVLGRLYLLGR